MALKSGSGCKTTIIWTFLRFLPLYEMLWNVSASTFIIERRLNEFKNGTMSMDIFTNPGGCFRPNVCSNFGGSCHNPNTSIKISHCCSCECRGGKNLFTSLLSGCSTASSFVEKNKIEGKHCMFYVKSHGFSKIPTFINGPQLNQSSAELQLSSNNGSLLDIFKSPNIWCFPRRIYYLTKFGRERLIFENSCLEIMEISQIMNSMTGSVHRFLKFTSLNHSDWELFNGKLLKVEIICNNTRENKTAMKSCIVFRVNGSYDDEVPIVSHHSPMICPPAPPYIPPSTTMPPTTCWNRHATAKIIAGTVGAVLFCIAVVVVVCLIGRFRKRKMSNYIVETAAEGTAEPFLDNDARSSPSGTGTADKTNTQIVDNSGGREESLGMAEKVSQEEKQKEDNNEVPKNE